MLSTAGPSTAPEVPQHPCSGMPVVPAPSAPLGSVSLPPSAQLPPTLTLCLWEPDSSQLLGTPQEVLEPKGVGAVTGVTLGTLASCPARCLRAVVLQG